MSKTTLVQRNNQRYGAWVLVLVGMSAVGCFRSLDTSKLTCSKTSSCPPNHYCSADEKCLAGIAPGGDAASPADGASNREPASSEVGTAVPVDGPSSTSVDGGYDRPTASGGAGGADTSAGGAGGTDVPMGGAGGAIIGTGGGGGSSMPIDAGSVSTDGPRTSEDSSVIDVPLGGSGGQGGGGSGGTTTLATGAPCQSDSQCTLGFCVDGVCCNSRCGGQCQACAEPGSVGTCTTVSSGNPRGIRTACSGTGQCKGSCDVSSPTACKMPNNETLCHDESCLAGQHTPASYCNGSGTCPIQEALPCSTGACANASTCAGSCTSTSCPTGQYCASSGSCAVKKGNGTGNTCTSGSECSSGTCSPDGVCCQAPCSGQCQTCNNSTGTCTRVSSGQPVGSRTACTNATNTTCGGRCNGTSDDCSYPPGSTSCGTNSCSTPSYMSKVAPVCDGAGYCDSSATTACTGSQPVCVNNNCSAKIATNAATTCQTDVQCASGHCCSGTCRDFSSDNSNCGFCGHACPSSTPSCTSGTCGCPQNQMNCNNTGCVDILQNNLHCGGCSTNCNLTPGNICNGGSCSCAGKVVSDCGCLSWNFNNSDIQGWSQGGGVRGTACNAPGFGAQIPPVSLDATQALYVDMTGDGAGCGVGLGANLCASGSIGESNGITLNGLTFSAKVLFVPSTGSGAYSGNIELWSYTSADMSTTHTNPVPANVWTTVTATISDSSSPSYGDTQFGILFFPGTWSGRVYIDNITIN